MKRDSFIFYRTFYEPSKVLSKEDFADFIIAICEFAMDEKEVELKGMSKLLFDMVKPNIVANNQRYKNGLKGGNKTKDEPKTNQSTTKDEPKTNQSTTKDEPNEDVYDNVNEDKNDNVDNKTFNVKTDLSYVDDYMLSLWGEWLDYKDEIKKQYKTQRGANTGYSKLVKYSENNIVLATAIIQNSIEHSWDGFFALSEKQREYFLSDNSPYKDKETSCIDKGDKPYYR